MSDDSTSLPPEPRFDMDLRTRSYVFTVVTLAAFALALLLFRPRVNYKVAETVLSYVPGEMQNADGVLIDHSAIETFAKHVLQELRDPAVLLPVAESIGLDSVDIDSLSQHLFARLEPQDGQPAKLRIRCISPNATFSTALLDQLAAEFMKRHNHAEPQLADPNTEDRAFAQATVEQWRTRYEELTKERDELLRSQLQQARIAHEQRYATPDTHASLPTPTPLPEVVAVPEVESRPAEFNDMPAVNAHWVTLHDELAKVQQELKSMLDTYTPEHPAVLQTMALAEAIRQELHRTPRTEGGQQPAPEVTESRQPELPEPPSRELTPPHESTLEVAFDESEAEQAILASEEFQQVTAQMANAADKLKEAEQHLSTLPAPEELAIQPAATSESTRIESAARIVELQRPALKWESVWELSTFAALMGVVLAFFRKSTRLPSYFISQQDVENTLDVPVITGVTQPSGPTFEVPENKTPQLVVAGIRFSEAVLVASVMLIVLGLATLPDFASNITSNPLDAFCIGLDHLEAYFAGHA